MITTMTMTTMILLTFKSVKSNNPVKMSFLVLITSSLLFFLIFMWSGNTWFSMIYFLMFMGGVLMLFMVLSSISPNEMSKKNKKIQMIVMVTLIWLVMETQSKIMSMESFIKISLLSNNNMMFMIAMIMFYFLCFIMLISQEKISMRCLE